jgi:hypothetical protein
MVDSANGLYIFMTERGVREAAGESQKQKLMVFYLKANASA